MIIGSEVWEVCRYLTTVSKADIIAKDLDIIRPMADQEIKKGINTFNFALVYPP